MKRITVCPTLACFVHRRWCFLVINGVCHVVIMCSVSA